MEGGQERDDCYGHWLYLLGDGAGCGERFIHLCVLEGRKGLLGLMV